MSQPALLFKPTDRFQTPSETLSADMFEVAIDGVPGRNIELRERVPDFFQLGIAPLGNRHGAGKDSGSVLENLPHLFRRLNEELIAVKFQPICIVDRLASLNADEHVMRMGIVFAE